MPHSDTLYNLDFRQKSTRNRIIGILGKQYPLKINQINNLLRRNHGIRVTYQAVHIFLKELIVQGAVVKEGKGYMLNPIWVESISSAANEILERYGKNGEISAAKEFQELNFGSMRDAWEFIIKKASTGFFGKSEICYIQLKRMFCPILSEEQALIIREFAKSTKTVLLCHSNGPVERLASNFLRSQGVDVRLGVPCAVPTNTALIGNSVVSIYVLYPDKGAVDRLYSSIKDILKKDVFSAFSGLMLRKIKVKLIINRNPGVYEDVLDQTKQLISN